MFRREEQKIIDGVVIDNAFREARKIARTHRVDEAKFKGLDDESYSEIRVERDRKKARDIKGGFEDQSQFDRLVEVVETAIFYESEMSNWLGGEVRTILTSLFDDCINGIDCVVEFRPDEEGPEYLGLAIDVTISSDDEILGDEKKKRMEKEAEGGVLGEVKYVDPEADEPGLKQVPKVLVGIEKSTAEDLIEKWKARRARPTKENKEALQGHIVQFIMLEEIRIQLEYFRDFAERVENEEMKEIYNRLLEIINSVIRDKRDEFGGDMPNPDELASKDYVFRKIRRMFV